MHNATRREGTVRRAKAAAAILGLNFSDVARRCDCSLAHLRGVLLGERKPSEALNTALRDTYGATWGFVIGSTDTLHVPS